MTASLSLILPVFLAGALVAAFCSGIAGFAFGVVASSIWLHVLPPSEAVPLVAGCGLTIHLVSIWHLRRQIRFDLAWPFLLGAVPGVPLGAWILSGIDPSLFKVAIGCLLAAYGVWALGRPDLPVVKAGGRVADGAVGFVGGVLGGLGGLNGMLPTIWCGLRGWPKQDQRGVYQPYIFVAHCLTLAALGGGGMIGARTMELYLWSLPALGLGALIGLAFYSRVEERQFRRILAGMILLSGLALVI